MPDRSARLPDLCLLRGPARFMPDPLSSPPSSKSRWRRLPRPLRHLAREIGRGWQWVVFVFRMLGRLGGPRQWCTALATTLGLMRQRHGRALPELRHEAWFYDPEEFPFTQVLRQRSPRILAELQALRKIGRAHV